MERPENVILDDRPSRFVEESRETIGARCFVRGYIRYGLSNLLFTETDINVCFMKGPKVQCLKVDEIQLVASRTKDSIKVVEGYISHLLISKKHHFISAQLINIVLPGPMAGL